MYISLYKGNTFKEIEGVLVQHIPASKALEIRGDGAFHAVIVYSSQKDFKNKSQKLLEALSIGEELFDIESGIFLSKQKITNDEIAIIFPGQGSQYVGMLKPFIQYDVFQRETKKLLEDSEKLGISLSPLLNSGDQNQLNQTQYSQPALAVVSYALLKLLKSYNLKCKNFAGHSFGELMALCAAEAYNSQTLMKLSIERGRLMSMAGVTAPGKMVAVIEKGSKNYEDLHQKIEELNILDPSIELANINTHTQLVYTGPASKILAFKEVLSKNNLKCALLSSSAAFHGKLMEPAAEEFECFIEDISEEIHSPRYYVVSSSPNAKYTSKEHVIHYLAEQLQEQVNWVKAIKNLRSSGVKVFLEVGPKNVLTKMVQELIPENEAHVIALDNGLPLEHTLGYLLSLGVELTLKDKLIPKTEGNYKIIQGFVEKQKALVEKAQAITDDAQRESVQSQIMRDTEEVLGQFYSLTGTSTEVIPEKKPEKASDETTNIILEELASVTGFSKDDLSLDAQFDNDLYLDSITHLEFLSRLSDKFKVAVTNPTALLNANSVRTLVSLLKQGQGPSEELTEELIWIRKEISNYTGIPEDRITLKSRFTEDLMLDSLFKMDLLGEIQARYPSLQIDLIAFSKVNTLEEAAEFFNEKTDSNEKSIHFQKKFSKYLAESLASFMGLSIDKILSTTDFSHDLKMNIFEKEDFISSLVIKHSYLQMASRELLHANTVGDIIELEKHFDRRSSGRGTSEQVGRFTFRKIMVEGGNFAECELPNSLLVLSLHDDEKTNEVVSHLKKMKKNIKLRHVKGLKVKSIDKAISELGFDSDVNILILGAPKKHSSEDINLTFELGKLLNELGRKSKGLTVKMLINGQNNIFWKGFIGFCRAFSKEVSSTFSVVEMPWNKKSVDVIPWSLLWDQRDDQKNRCRVYHMEGKTFYREELQEATVKLDQYALKLPKKPHILLVGGARGITAEVAKYLADNNQAIISAFGRTDPSESMPFEDAEGDEELRKRIKNLIEQEYSDLSEEEKLRQFKVKLREVNNQREIWKTKHSIESRGGRFIYYKVDATNLTEIKAAIKSLESSYGKIHGIIHAAGMTKDSLLGVKSSKDFSDVITSKVKSALNLRSIFKDRKDLSFVCFFSSLSSWSGAPGQTDYSLANEIINLIAQEWDSETSFPVASLLWSVWNETGLASETLLSQMQILNLGGISNRAGVRLFKEELFHHGLRNNKVLFAPETTLNYSLENYP